MKIKLCALVLLSLTLSNCGSSSIKTAKKFSEASSKIEILSEEVSNDIYQSCARSATWRAKGTTDSRRSMREDLKVCDNLFRANSENANIAGMLIVGYLKAIGQLATENREAVATKFDEVGNALGEIKVETQSSVIQLEQNTIDTGKKIAVFITNILFTEFRKKNLKAAILCTNDDIQEYSNQLSSFFERLYVKELLDDEIDALTRYAAAYRSPLTDKTNLLLDSGSPQLFTDLQNTQMERDTTLRQEVNKVIERKNRGALYVKLIRETAASHADLKKVFNKGEEELDEKQIEKCKNYFNETPEESNNNEVNEFETLSIHEVINIELIANRYIEKIEPIIEELESKNP